MTFELYKSTYMSAARELEPHHPKRAEDLKSWAKKGGISALANKDVDRDWPYPFVFENYQEFKGKGRFWEEGLQGEFYITRYRIIPSSQMQTGYNGMYVDMISDFGEKVKIQLVMHIDRIDKMRFSLIGPDDRDMDSNWFKFENRKDAMEFRKYVTEIAFDEGLDDLYNVETLPINQLYTTK